MDNRGLAKAGIVVLLAALLAIPAALYVLPAVEAQTTYSAWLKIVTDSWDGAAYGDGFTTPVMPAGIDFPGRYNATNVCVELYRFLNPNSQDPAPLTAYDGPINAGSPNGTGFIKVSWPASWENVTIIVKAKSYQGECIGAGSPFSGIIVYWLTINGVGSFLERFFGTSTSGNYTIGDDGIQFTHPGPDFDFTIDAPFNAGPIDHMDMTPAQFAAAHADPRNASVAHAAYIFKLFHEHTWYDVNDVLTYGIIFIYDVDHTPANSPRSLIQAAITGPDGQSRYTREIYPKAAGLGPTGKFRDNRLVPIPLQTINRFNATPFHGGIRDPEDSTPDGRASNIGAPHLNATTRVWWETVLTNQTFYVGREYNGTANPEYAMDSATGKTRPLFGAYPSVQDPSDPLFAPSITQGGITGVPAGPLSLALNNTIHYRYVQARWYWNSDNQTNVANFNNNTVFYARFCVQDADLKIQHPEIGDKMVGAEVTINLKKVPDRPYYLSHNILTTDAGGCTATPHKWPGYLDQFSNFARFPNGTNWGLRGSLNVSKAFDPADDTSPAWKPGGYFERAWGGDWNGPYINAGRNWTALIPEINYMKTRTLADDPNYDGFDVQVKWKGGSRNNYGGTPVLVDSIRVKNPYAIALLYDYVNDAPFGGWVFPYTVLANNKLWLMIHDAEAITGDISVTDPVQTMLEVMGPFGLLLTDFDTTTGRFDVTIEANGYVAVNNASDPTNAVDWALSFGDSFTIDDALVSFKKHDVMYMWLSFEAGQGQADRGVDGSDDYTTVDLVTVNGGPFELEFWPGPPGTGTVRVLVSGHDLDVCILPNNLNTCPNIRDFTGAILFKGPPRIIYSYTYTSDDPSGSVSGEYTTQELVTLTFSYTVDFTTPITSGPELFDILETPEDLGLTFIFHPIIIPDAPAFGLEIDADGNSDDAVWFVGSLELHLDPLELHYAWLYTESDAFAVVSGSGNLYIDYDASPPTFAPDVNIPCTTFSVDSTDVQIYHDPDTGEVTIATTASITTTCTATNVDIDGDGYDDSFTVTVVISPFTLVYQHPGPWGAATLTYVSGSIDSTQTLEIDIDSNGVDYSFTSTVSVDPPTTLAVTDTGEDDSYENTVNNLSCTLSGTVPYPSGIASGTITCSGYVDFIIDIGNDGITDVTVFDDEPLSGSGTITITTSAGTVTITGSASVATASTTGDFDNGGPIPDPLDDFAIVDKTIDVNIVAVFSPPGLVVTSGGLTMTGSDNIDINYDGTVNIEVPETGDVDMTGNTITLATQPKYPGIITGGTVTSNSLLILDAAGVEQIFIGGTLEITALTQVDGEPASTTTITVVFSATGSITHGDRVEAEGFATVTATDFSFPGGPNTLSASGTIVLYCLPIGAATITCSASVDFDGFSGAGHPVSGTLVINYFESTLDSSDSFFFYMEEIESLTVSGTIPAADNVWVDADGDGAVDPGETTTSGSVTLQGGILSVGPIVKASITDMDFSFDSHFYSLAGITAFDPMVIGGRASGTTIAGISIPAGVEGSFSITLNQPVSLFIFSFVVPLSDFSNDDEHLDEYLFGGYDDFALTGTGMVYITAWVHDVAFKVVDNMGNTLPASNTVVTLTRLNGPDVTRSGTATDPDQRIGNLDWSYRQWAGADTGYAIFYQLPGDQAYGVIVRVDGVVVYEEPYEIEKLTKTELITIVAQVFKLKVLVLDCNGQTLGSAYLSYIDQTGARRITKVDDFGAMDFGFVPAGGIRFTGVWWKGVWVTFVKAEVGDTELPLEPDGTLSIGVDSNVDSPVKLYANIIDIKFTPYDFNGDNIIPRLNITLMWVGEHPLTGRKLWFLETLDPSGDTNPQPFNTTVQVDQFLRYTVRYFEGEPDTDGDLKTYSKAEYVFYQMPPTLYNITVTTVTDPDYDPDTEQTPGSAKWPGRTVPVAYEIKIKYTSTSSPPVIITSPADYVNDRVVLRIFSTFNPDRTHYGRPVDETWPFEGALDVYNPGGVGDFTGVTECEVSRRLLVWAHTFFKRIVDGATRVGGATYSIVNDNELVMEFYNPNDDSFYPVHLAFWTEDTVDTTWLRKTSQSLSVIWWNGSYRAEGLELPTNMTFTVDKWWNNSATNKVWPRHNFTVQPSRLHFETMGEYVVGNWTKIEETVAPYGNAIVFEKQTLQLPAPVTFVKPKAVDKGGEPLENALIEAWILNLELSERISISADSGSAELTRYYLNPYCNATLNQTYNIAWEWERKRVADPDDPQRFIEVRWDRLYITINDTVTIFVQVPPWPAKLFIRNVLDDLDLVVTSRWIYATVDNPNCPIDNNVGASTPRTYPDGQLAYAQWETGPDGLIRSFTVPGYEGLLLLPTSGWLNHTFSVEGHLGETLPLREEFHYQFNVVWKSAVVYSDNFVLDKQFVEFGASEVYDVRFMFTLSNSTDPAHAVRNLNLWIYYPNVTTWHSAGLWNAWPPAPQDYKPCSTSDFPCNLRVTLISSSDADGVVEFSKIPGPRFMNTTWKYVFSANHSAVTWLKDLVATQFVLNNETFGDGPLKVVTTNRVTVPIMLNAARQLSVVLLTWRDEQGVPTAYPVQGYTVKLQGRRLGTPVDTGVMTRTSDSLGFATFESDPTDVTKVFWYGLTVRYRVEPPTYVNEPDDTKWRDWMNGLNVQLVEQPYNTPTRRSSFAYFPTEEPTHWAITSITTTFDEYGYCFGLCTYYDEEQGRTVSKPFVITVNYAAVTVRAIDFNGRPLAGAFVELVDRASGRIAAWSYTANATWSARPIDLDTLYKFHRGELLDPRPIGGAGYTAIMNLTFGAWNYDANNDDAVDNSGVRNPLRLIVRVYWLANDPTPDNAVGNLWPVWPFRDETAPLPRHVKVYDSDFDETDADAKTLTVPDSEAAIGMRLPDRTISEDDPVSRGVHRDVTTAVFDFMALLNYGGKTLPDEILRRLEVFVHKKVGATTELSLRFTEGVGMSSGTFTINRLPRGVYELEVRFGPAGTIFKRTFDISTVNVGTVQVEASLPFTDLSFEVTDLRGRPLTIAPGDVSIEPEAYYFRREVAGNVITVTALYTGAPVTVTVRYTSPTYGTTTQVTLTDTADGIRTRLIGGRTLQLPVDDVVIIAVDAQGRPVGGAVVTFQGVTKTTGPDGRAVFERVPLGTEDSPLTYNLRVSVEGVEVYARDEPISVARKEISVLAQLFTLTVRVVGELGQGLEGASVQLLRAGTTVATGSADSAGAVRFEKLAPASYEVRAQYKGFSGSATVSLDALRRGEVVEIRLPVYVEVLGIPMSLATLLALAIGLILLVIVLAIIISEYRWWRGRRLGVYAPPPPKAPAK